MRQAILLVTLLVAAAAAGEIPLAYRDGRTANAKAASADDEGLLLEDGSRVLWGELRPESALAARRALTSAEDGAARLALFEFALSLDLHAEAQRELEIAFALKAIDEAEFERREKALEEAEIESFRIRIDGLLETDDHPDETLRAIRALRERHPDHPLTLSYEPRVKELVDRLAAMESEEKLAREEATKDKALDALRVAIGKLEAKKAAAVAKGDELLLAGTEAAGKGQISRTLKSLTEPTGAEKQFKSARSLLREMARVDRRFQVVSKEQIQKEAEALSGKLVDCYLVCARTLLGQRNYKGAAEFVRKVLLYDPIQEEALEMAEEIKRNRISFKVSDLTNARPRVSGG